MTATVTARQSRSGRRWHRIVIPLAVVGLFWAVTGAARTYQEPNPAAADTLSPTGTGRHGSSELARLLAERGVTVEHVTTNAALLAAVSDGEDATVFVPVPLFLTVDLQTRVDRFGGSHRIVYVRPASLYLPASDTWAWRAESRWATGRAEPGCDAPYAVHAGSALVRRDRVAYARFDDAGRPHDRPASVCYAGSLVGFRDGNVETIVVGASEPFRNDRIHEAGNAALATALLAEHGRVIWADIHRLDIELSAPQVPQAPPYQRGERDRTATGNDLLDTFPAQLWAVLLVLLVAAALTAVVRGRRLGPPVVEPLPVLVPGSETITGRGRLYERARARPASLATLRAAAVARLARALTPLERAPERAVETPGAARDAFLAEVASRAGVSLDAARAILFGPPPDNDTQLVQAAVQVDQLLAAVLSQPSNAAESAGGAP